MDRPAALRIAALVVSACLLARVAQAQGHTVTDLDAQLQLPWCTAYGIDDTGRTVGACLPSGSSEVLPVLFEGGAVSVLPILAGDERGYAFDINDQGLIVGSSVVILPDGAGTTTESHPILWTDGVPTDLRTLVSVGDGSGLEAAVGINASGIIVGSGVEASIGAARGFVFDGGTLTDIGALNGSPTGKTYPSQINDFAVVVGASESTSGWDHAFLWEAGAMTDLHVLGGIAGRSSRAFDVNRSGTVCGTADFTDDIFDTRTATVWVGGTAIDLGHLGGGEAWAAGLNDLGVVVGTSFLPGGTSTAFRWKDGIVEDLNDLIDPGAGWELKGAEDIDNDGRIVGLGIHDGAARPYVLTPDCSGGYTVYGSGCPGSGGVTPTLGGVSCPTPGETFALVVGGALPGAPGGLFVGSGSGILQVKPNCQLQVLPLALDYIPLPVDAGGGLFLPVRLGPGTPPFTANVQYLVADPCAGFGLASSNPLQIDFQ
ncbi:MAG: hypothetical protein ACYTG2_06355 [Planctomycetota bacterium]|jgi:probable HAF family extracellular repeat protein